ncbi:hypothetical protein [Enterococcus sp. AZ103]|uniref:hypothetical protein n=1 Tax=Enterococcus sp. AZ103 TaxID=2774628 RepID=UPI003F26026E
MIYQTVTWKVFDDPQQSMIHDEIIHFIDVDSQQAAEMNIITKSSDYNEVLEHIFSDEKASDNIKFFNSEGEYFAARL